MQLIILFRNFFKFLFVVSFIFFVSLLVLLSFSRHSKKIEITPQLVAGTNEVLINQNWWFRFIFQSNFSALCEISPSSGADVHIESFVGHYRVDKPDFEIPIKNEDVVYIRVELLSQGTVVILKNAVIHRKILPGAWLILILLLVQTIYFYFLSKINTRQQLQNQGLLFASIIVAILLLGIFVQIASNIVLKNHWYLFPPHLKTKFYIHPNITKGIPEGYGWFNVNSEGIRADERDLAHWDLVFSVLCIGASTTEGFYLRDKHWPKILQDKLKEQSSQKIWVGNAGHSAFPTKALAMVAKNYIPRINPKLVVILTGFNEGIVPDNKEEEESGRQRVGDDKKVYNSLKKFLKNIRLINLIYEPLFHPIVQSPNDIDMAGSNYSIYLAREKMKALQKNFPPKDREWSALNLEEFEKSIREINDIAKAQKSQLILCTQPTIYREDLSEEDKQLLWMMGNYTVKSKQMRMKMINDRMRVLAKELSIPLVDLEAVIPKTNEIFYDDCHFTVKGAEAVADKLSEFIKSNYKF